MRWRRFRPGLSLLLVGGLTVGCFTVPVARAQEQPEPADEVLAVLSPVASPVCSAAGASTLLVPILGGLAEEQLSLGEQISISDLLLDSLGPVFVTCGNLPAPDGTRCDVIDDQILALWPEDISSAGLTAPPLGGNLVEALDRAAGLLGLDTGDLLHEPLRCSIPAEAEAPSAPPAPPPALAPVAPTESTPPSPAAPPPVSPAVPATSPTELPDLEELATPNQPVTPVSSTMTVTDIVARTVPGGILLLQLLVAAALVAFLVGSWTRSLREARR